MFKYNIPFGLDTPERTVRHREIILNKPFLKNLYKEWYSSFTDEIPLLPPGKLLELGSGGGFLKEIIPDVICSDILPLPTNDMTFSGLQMPFKDEEISGLFMIDTFHHIPDAELFLREASRVLKKDGQIIMTEPANTTWGRFIYQNFHHEPFNPEGNWSIPDTGPLSGANGALPWIVFERDIKDFYERFPNLEITEKRYHTPLRYLLSGGVSYKPFVPRCTFKLFTGLEKLLIVLSGRFAMFMTIKIKKKY